ncbi:unnamed protein product [Auanema sp. JU1783]|nr:unnamed protein product [Auanema sp. JU1783]
MYSVYLILILNVLAVDAAYPKCPNDGEPKLDGKGNFIQCLPGDSFALSCGNEYFCYFSGINYLCCPSNEKKIKKQMTCPEPLITVLSSRGDVLKCSGNSHECSKRGMLCMNVGEDFICCEKHNHTAESLKDADYRVCPPNSSTALTPLGNVITCDLDRKCLNEKQFCFGESDSICCETARDDTKPITQIERKQKVIEKETLLSNDLETKREPVIDTMATTFQQIIPKQEPKNVPNEIRTNAIQQFIRDRIMNGWPYNEIFFHP